MGELNLVQKLNPRRFPGMSGKMASIVGYVVGESWTSPEISEMAITSDGGVLAGVCGDVGMNEFIGSVEDLDRNVRNLLVVAGVDDDEKAEWQRLFRARVRDWRNGR